MNARSALKVAFAVTILAWSGCSRCGKPTPASGSGIERLLPRGAVAVLVVPNVQALGERLQGLENLKVAGFSAQLNGFTDAHQWADAVVQQLGIDLRSKAALEKAGLDPSGSAAVVATLDGSVFLVLTVSDEAKVASVLQKLAGTRLGANVAEDRKDGELTVHAFVTVAGAAPRLGYVKVKNFVLVGFDRSVLNLPVWARLSDVDSLATDTVSNASLQRLPKDRDLVIFLPPGSPALRGTISSATASLSVRPEGLTLTADAPWTGDAKALEVLVKQPGSDLLGYLPDDAWGLARFSGDPTQLAPWIQRFAPQLKRAFDEARFPLDSELLANLKPGCVAGLSLAPTARMGGMPELDLRSTNPFTYVHLTGILEAKNPQQIQTTLDTLAGLAPRIGATMSKTDRQGHPVYFTTYSAGEGVHLAARGPLVFFGSPAARIDALLKSDGKAQPVSNAALKGVLDSRALSVAVDVQKLARAVRELPSAAWGIGGFAIKATAVRWLDATDDLEAITLGFESRAGAVQGQLVLSLTPSGPPPKKVP